MAQVNCLALRPEPLVFSEAALNHSALAPSQWLRYCDRKAVAKRRATVNYLAKFFKVSQALLLDLLSGFCTNVSEGPGAKYDNWLCFSAVATLFCIMLL
jgi:hypothetical protein